MSTAKMSRAVSVMLSALAIALAMMACKAKAEPLPELGQVQPFELSDQGSNTASLISLAGKPWIAAFMFTRCPSICPRITQTMKGLQTKARERDLKVQLVSFSVDPQNDTPAVLSEYAKKFGADLGNWSFLTGDSRVIQRTAEESFKIGLEGNADPEKEHFGITHGSHFVLVDTKAMIRGFYRSDDEAEMDRLLNDVAQLQ